MAIDVNVERFMSLAKDSKTSSYLSRGKIQYMENTNQRLEHVLIPWKSPDDDPGAILVHRLDICNCTFR